MNPLEPPDSQHLEAAQGWLDLGNHIEANEELEQISPLNRAHPAVLRLRWRIDAKAGKWDACLDIATALTRMAPDRRFGWLQRAEGGRGGRQGSLRFCGAPAQVSRGRSRWGCWCARGLLW